MKYNILTSSVRVTCRKRKQKSLSNKGTRHFSKSGRIKDQDRNKFSNSHHLPVNLSFKTLAIKPGC